MRIIGKAKALFWIVLVASVMFHSFQAEAKESEVLRRLNIRVMPVGMLLGEYMGDVNYAITGFLSLGVIGYKSEVELLDAKATGDGFGGRATLHFSGHGFSDSWILSGYYYRVGKMSFSDKAEIGGDTVKATVTDVAEYGAVIGKNWVWGSGFNMTLAVGARNLIGPKTIVLKSSDGSSTSERDFAMSGVRLEFALGWAF